ncbi:MAG TPA: putative ABC exporter domain-containing protein [Gemmatimonadales bacterium]
MSARALGFLVIRSVRNRFLRQLRRVRSPRYAFALLAGLGYLALLLGNPRRQPSFANFPTAVIEVLVASGVLFVVAWSWLYAHDRRALTFRTAEVTFLFPAPLARRTLINYKLLRAQLLILLNTAIWTVLLDAGRVGLPLGMRAVGVWCALSTLQMHRLGATLVRTSLGDHGWYGLRNSLVSAIVVMAAAVLVLGAAIQAAPVLGTIGGFDDVAPAIAAIAELPLPAIVLVPFRALMAPLYAESPAAWWRAIGPALVLLLLHYLWVIRSEAAFEESAAAASFARMRELAERRTGGAARAGGYSAPVLPLRPGGPPAGAIVWKNVAMILRRRRARVLGFALCVSILGAVAAREAAPRFAATVGTLLLMWAGLLVTIGPQWVRNDLRSDLARLDLLRSYPLDGGSVVRAESAGSAIIVTLLQLAMSAVAVIALWREPAWALGEPAHAALLVAGVVVLPFVNYVGLMLFNGAALIFPAWVTPGSGRGGVDTLGQNLLTAVAYTIALLLTLIVPLCIAAVAWAMAGEGPWAVVPAAAAASATLALEAWLLSLWLGGVFERLDPPQAGIESAI